VDGDVEPDERRFAAQLERVTLPRDGAGSSARNITAVGARRIREPSTISRITTATPAAALAAFLKRHPF